MIPQRASVLYTSTTKLGAIAEITFHWGLLTPPPTKPAVIHELLVSARKSVRIQRGDFAKLGISLEQFGDRGYARTQEIGAAVAFLGFDGLFVPSARSAAENFVLLHDNHQPDLELTLVSNEEVALSLPPRIE